jgi:hypothetical protein
MEDQKEGHAGVIISFESSMSKAAAATASDHCRPRSTAWHGCKELGSRFMVSTSTTTELGSDQRRPVELEFGLGAGITRREGAC